MLKYPPLTLAPRIGDEPFTSGGQSLDIFLRDFWRWAVSDLVENTTRGRLAEFIVANALGLHTPVRDSWAPYDLKTPNGVEIQVKCSAYLQSWGHEKLSEIRFDVRPKRAWDFATNVLGTELKRHCHVYVFCLLHHQDKSTLDPLDLAQWTFYVLPTAKLNAVCPAASSISVQKLLTLEPVKAEFDSLAQAVRMIEPHAL
jgi:hypothetical protein